MKCAVTDFLSSLTEFSLRLEDLERSARTLEDIMIDSLASPSWEGTLRTKLNSRRFEDLLTELAKGLAKFGSSATAMSEKLTALAERYTDMCMHVWGPMYLITDKEICTKCRKVRFKDATL